MASGEEDAKPDPISMGIIVNFTNRTVEGFGQPGLMDYPVKSFRQPRRSGRDWPPGWRVRAIDDS
jgi:hypothetical protein